MKTGFNFFAYLLVGAAMCELALACSPTVYLKCQAKIGGRVACVQSKSGKCSPSSAWEATDDATKYSTLTQCKENLCSREETCSDNGDCTPAGTCTCDDNYFTGDCGVYCEANSTCSGNGTCTSDGTCSCNAGHLGTDCSDFCSREATCNNNGDCTSTGDCECDDNYHGDTCDYFCNDAITCSGNGTCNGTTQQCDCATNYFGESCSVFCLASSTCGGNGVCDSSGQCDCNPNFVGDNCQPPPALRLVGYNESHTGFLQIQIDGVWGTVCDDGFDLAAARVACRQLGFGIEDVDEFNGGYNDFDDSDTATSPIWLDDVVCTGNETTLSECEHPAYGIENCDHTEDVGISCAASEYNPV